MCVGSYVKIVIVIFILGYFLNKCGEQHKPIPLDNLDNFKGAVITDKESHETWFIFRLKIKGKKQDIQVDSFYYQYLYVIESDYKKYSINDTIK